MNIAEFPIPESSLNAIEAISKENTIEPTIPIDTYLQDAENLVLWAKDDLNELAKVGINQQHIDELRVRIDICRKVQTYWIHYKETQSELDKSWKKELQAGKDIYRELVHYFTYAFRNNEELSKTLKRMKKANKYSALIHSLASLSNLGSSHKDLLEKVSFDFQLLERASNLSNQLGYLASKYHVKNWDTKATKRFRDKTYTYLKLCIDEIRDAGKFVFRDNKKRLRGYMIAYYLKKNAEHRTNKPVLR
ncbi:hypothetical protein [Marinifilum flexuosum]|uniref:Uncharacterized protein n=1 Tax=Marinifilum flexuosum TaxID=1117708 RepID=A0A419WT08_9BACT|nr:hypothetical protein [Marinifilum flexuosum]RKD98609.1 hypothetical protein BXY64_3468 [Marinifilum flexuosum]